MNKVLLKGNLGRDPELSFTKKGTARCTMSVATTERPRQGQEVTEWHRVTVWGPQAEACAKYLTKGNAVFVEGKNHTRSWDNEAGEKVYVTEVHANSVDFLTPKTKSDASESEPEEK